jgi:peptidoglycan-associated lipoprotein
MPKRPTPNCLQAPLLCGLKPWLLLVMLALAASCLRAQSAPAPVKRMPLEAAGAFHYVHSNAPPGGCGCFSLFGGSGSIAYTPRPHVALVGEFAMINNNNVENTGHILTIATVLFGARVPYPVKHTRYTPFAQALIGVGHDYGVIAQVNASGPSSYNAFAAALGGGLDIQLSRRISLRAAEVDYLVTTFPNRAGNHQNNTRVSSGVAVRF